MTLPTLPTDNLYKFNFLSGVTLILAGMILFFTQANKIIQRQETLISALTNYKNAGKFLKEDADELDAELKAIKQELKQWKIDTIDINSQEQYYLLTDKLYNNKNFRDYYGFLLEHKNDLNPLQKRMKQADEKQKLLKDIRRKFLRNAELSTIKSEAINSESRSFHTLAIATIFLAIGGLALAILGYRDWYMRVQKPLDEKLRLEIEQLKKPKAPY